MAAGDSAEKKHRTETFGELLKRKKSLIQLKSRLKKYIESVGNIIFLVDELDRCRPDYAIEYLEVIKHIFDVKKSTFIIAADLKHLENSAKTAFGSGLNFDEYFRRFVHRTIRLPPPSEDCLKGLIDAYSDQIVSNDKRSSLVRSIMGNPWFVQLIVGLRLTPRQLQEVFRIIGHVASCDLNDKSQLRFYSGLCVCAMAVFKVAKPELYEALGRKLAAPRFVYEQLANIEKRSDWCAVLRDGGGIRMQLSAGDTDIVREWPKSEDDYTNWGTNREVIIPGIRERIDHITTWAK